MRAKLVEYNFERGKNPKDQMKIGYGPAKPEYINDFIEAMDDASIRPVLIKRKEFGDLMIWELRGKDSPYNVPNDVYGNSVYLIPPGDDQRENSGWHFKPYEKRYGGPEYLPTPYPIIRFILEAVSGDIKTVREQIQALEDSLEIEKGSLEMLQKWSKKWS